MKALIAYDPRFELVRIDFDREIPSFPDAPGPNFKFRNKGLLFSRNELLCNEATAMAYQNAGNLPIEFSSPSIDVYEEFLQTLLLINGFVGIRSSDRYGLSVVIGKLFDPLEAGKEIALVIQSHFYPDEKIEYLDQLTGTICDCPTNKKPNQP